MENWVKELPVAFTVCDADGVILEMNKKSIKTFEKSGGEELIGKNVMDCHPGEAKKMLSVMLKEPQMNAYTIEKNGVKKLIYQTPWFEDGAYKGFVEISLEIPMEMKHFVRAAIN